MSTIEFYFSVMNVILLIIMFIWSYLIDYNYNKKNNEVHKLRQEVKKMNDELTTDEQFYKTIINKLSNYYILINKKQVIDNGDKIEIVKKEPSKFEKFKNFFRKKTCQETILIPQI